MALIDDDQVKKAGREFPEGLLAVFWPGDGLIKPQVDLVCSVDAALRVQRRSKFDLGAVFALNGLRPRAQFRHSSAKRAEIIHHCLIDQDVTVGEKEDAFLATGLRQTSDNLKCRVGLAGAGGHDEEDSVLALGDRFYRGVDGI